MLKFAYRTQQTIYGPVKRPLVKASVQGRKKTRQILALIDSGADISIIPEGLAITLNLPVGQEIITRGIAKETKGYRSVLNITLLGNDGVLETIYSLPVYVLPNISACVLGREHFFDNNRITFEQYNNLIMLESHPETSRLQES